MTHAFHQTKFRWTENLTSRFIQLRKENGNLFTGRKYSAQAGWEHILQQMRQEFPTIMADVHYRVLKKKWSNLLQQYKELKNPVHGDKNKSDDVSWPFYGAIDEVLGYGQRNDDDDLNPHEFLCLSVTPEEPASPELEEQRLGLIDSDVDHDNPSITAIKQIRNFNDDFSIEIERLPGVPIRRPRPSSRPSRISQELRRRDASEVLVSRLPPATELSIKTIRSSPCSSSVSIPGLRVRKFTNNKDGDDSPRQFLRDALAVTAAAAASKRNGNHNSRNYNEEDEEDDDDVDVEVEVGEEDEEELEEEDDEDDEEKQRPRKLIRRYETAAPAVNANNDHQSNLEKRLTEFFEYTKRRDEENRIIMTRILNAVERIAEKQ